MSREHELVRAAAYVRVDMGAQERLRRLASDELDWTLVARAAFRHGVAPLVFHTLTATKAVDPANVCIAPLRERFFTNAAHSLVLTRELVDLLALFEDIGIAAIPYKGPVLAASLYGNLALREFTDLDVLVAPRDVPTAREALVRRGYERQILLTTVQEKALVDSRVGYFMRFDRSNHAGPIPLELHWRIPSTFSLDGRLGHRLPTVQLLDRQVPHFPPEELLLLLCVHGYKHAWNQLKWICDLGELVQRYPALDWELALDRATRMGGLRILLLGCALASTVLGTKLPPHTVARIQRDRVVPSLAALLGQRLFDRPLPRAGVINNFQIREQTRDKIRYGLDLLQHLTMPTVTERISWPDWPGARLVYTLAHPFRLVGRVARKHRVWNTGV